MQTHQTKKSAIDSIGNDHAADMHEGRDTESSQIRELLERAEADQEDEADE